MKGKKWLSILTLCFVMILSCGLLSACGSNVKLTINFDSNGGTECSSIEYVVGKSFNMPNDPTKDGYVFDGWYEDEDKWEKPFTTNTVLNYPLSKNMEITVYAKWLPRLTITFDSNGGSECESMPFIDFDSLPTPTRSNYIFNGWYLDFGVWQNKFNNISITQIAVNSNVTLYAKWSLERKLVFETNGGKEVESLNITDYSNINLPTTVKPFCVFAGWFMDEALTIPFDVNQLHFNEYQTEVKVYAKWDEEAKAVKNVEIYGTPKTEYLYGEELDLQGMYAEVNYHNYESEKVEITKDMVSGFSTTTIIKDPEVHEFHSTMTITVKDIGKSFNYSVKSKYKEVKIKEGSIKTEFLLGEDSTYNTFICTGKNTIPTDSYFGLKCVIVATNKDGTKEEIDVVARTKKNSKIDIHCAHDGFTHNKFIIYTIESQLFLSNSEEVNRNVYFPNENKTTLANAFTDLITDSVGNFAGTLYFGLLSTTFNYSVQEAESQVESYEQKSDYNFIKDINTQDGVPSQDRSIKDEIITIILKNGRKFDWTVPQENIVTDFSFEKSIVSDNTAEEKGAGISIGPKQYFECLVNLPVANASATLLKIKYTVISLQDIDYISLSEYNLKYDIDKETNKLKYISSSAIFYFTLKDNTQKNMTDVSIWSSNIDSCPTLDLTPGEHEMATTIKGVEVLLKYSIPNEDVNDYSQNNNTSENFQYNTNTSAGSNDNSNNYFGGIVGKHEDSDNK